MQIGLAQGNHDDGAGLVGNGGGWLSYVQNGLLSLSGQIKQGDGIVIALSQSKLGGGGNPLPVVRLLQRYQAGNLSH